ncbi:transcription cofactor vestigial-like protein 2 [Haliotis rubra]|uniref:transcription cofactor vestigial-like protein 2 n=1 Tax=Haliotis rubra TaxID=36100 RepID=UPI001EE61C8F|nr:transcription cofactor vestigial-like protein 2 [Haliotis rubra]
MTCVDLMYQFYSPYFPYKSASDENQKFGVPSMYESPHAGHYVESSPGSEREGEPAKENQPKGSQYLNPNCLLLTYFTGDIASVVDEHFSRALSQPSSYTIDRQGSKTYSRSDTSLMCNRKLPPSFWNSSYQPPPSASGSAHSNFPLSADSYFSSSLYGLHKNWPYYTTQAHTYGHQGPHAFSYSSMDSASRLNSHYNSLMMQNPSIGGRMDSRHAQYDLGKSSDAFTAAGYYSMGRFGSDIASTVGVDSGISGLDLPLQQTKKEMYW